jgi:hypothetical protein
MALSLPNITMSGDRTTVETFAKLNLGNVGHKKHARLLQKERSNTLKTLMNQI